MISANIPYPFLAGFGELTWPDVEFGLTRRYISSEVAIEYACSRVAAQAAPNPDELMIAGCSKQDSILETVTKLAAKVAPVSQNLASRWLCILIAWVYENRAVFEDPLQIVEEIYIEFDYPEEIASLIRYMPSDEPSLPTLAQNEARLITRWGEFVARCRALAGGDTGGVMG